MEHENGAPGVKRRGMAMILVLVMSVVILAMGMAMIGLSGDVLSGTVDTKTKIRARYAAETSISVAIADAVYQAGEIFGGGVSASSRSVAMGPDQGNAKVTSDNNLGQEVILQKRSPMNNLRGNKIPLKIEATGKAGSAKSRISASVALYQVPIYQFGVFYDGPLEITPGPNMEVRGRVHTNSNAYFRGAATLSFQGPVTVVGDIFQWVRSGGHVKYQVKPDSGINLYEPSGLNTNLAKMTAATQPPPIGGVSNVRFNETKIVLPIGVGTPRSILGIRDSSDPVQLRRQKFDWLVLNRSSPDARFVFTGTETPPSWIDPEPKVFFDRRELKWVKVWDFDPSKLDLYGNEDSIFYLDDLTASTEHAPSSTAPVINAFRIINGSVLPRNMTIASGKPIYIRGDFNTKDGTGNTNNYKNAQIAADAVTVLSSQWQSWGFANITNNSGALPASRSSMEQPFSNANWVSCTNCPAARAAGYTGNALSTNVRINAAMITGNKPTPTSCLNSTTESAFENCYEGGWHNTLRFLENWGETRTVEFFGSFVCLWDAQTPGLRTNLTHPGVVVIRGGHYNPPKRVWGYDTRFNDLNNMPPGSPFLATAILTNWLERK